MPTKIFVGRISEGTSSDEIRTLFSKFGKVVECDVITNYGFVHMDSAEEAKAAISALDGYNVNGSRINVEMSTVSTQGRKRKMMDTGGSSFRGGGREGRGGGYPGRRDGYGGDGGRRYEMPPAAAQPPAGYQREEFASEQVKDLLELYIRDPVTFDQYARTYYYGEHAERRSAAAGYYDGRGGMDRSRMPPSAVYRR